MGLEKLTSQPRLTWIPVRPTKVFLKEILGRIRNFGENVPSGGKFGLKEAFLIFFAPPVIRKDKL